MLLAISFVSGLISIIAALYFYFYVSKQSAGTPKMREISDAIRKGALAYLKREYMTLTAFVFVLSLVLYFFINSETAIAYVIGSFSSSLSSLFGMDVALKAKARNTN